jgi:1-acyl-sn-glycerol-3-phosphate acyltransferase
MLNALVIVSIIVLFICYDFLLSLSRFLYPSKAFDTTDSFAKRSVRHIFNIMRTYSHVGLDYANISGSELPDRFLLVTNHQSFMDIPLCIALFPHQRLRFVAKRELGGGIPFVSLVLKSQGHALIRRKGDASHAMRSIVRFARRCEREKTCPVIFPEGTRTRDGSVGVFHTAGVRKILDETPLPLVVAVLDGGWRVAKVKDVIQNLGGARLKVRVLSVTPTLSSKKEVLDALSTAREAIVLGLAQLRAEGSFLP